MYFEGKVVIIFVFNYENFRKFYDKRRDWQFLYRKLRDSAVTI